MGHVLEVKNGYVWCQANRLRIFSDRGYELAASVMKNVEEFATLTNS